MPRVVLTPLGRSRSKQFDGQVSAQGLHVEEDSPPGEMRQRSHSPARRAPVVRSVGRPWLRLPPKHLPTVTGRDSRQDNHANPPLLRGYKSPYAADQAHLHTAGQFCGAMDTRAGVSRVGRAMQTNLSLKLRKTSRRNKWLAPNKDVQAEDVALCMLATHKLEVDRQNRVSNLSQSADNLSRESLVREGSLDSWHLPPEEAIVRSRRASNVQNDDEGWRSRRSSSAASIDLSQAPNKLMAELNKRYRQQSFPHSLSGGSSTAEDSQSTGLLTNRSKQSIRSRLSRRSRPTSPELSDTSFDEASSAKSQYLALLFQSPACEIMVVDAANTDDARVSKPLTKNILRSWLAAQPAAAAADMLASGHVSPILISRRASSGPRSSGSISPGGRSQGGLGQGEELERGAGQLSTQGGFVSGRRKSKQRRREGGDEAEAEAEVEADGLYRSGLLESVIPGLSATEAGRKADVKALRERKMHFARVLAVLRELGGTRLKSVAELRKFLIRYCPPGAVQLTSSLIGLDKALGMLQLHEAFFARVLPDMVRRALSFFSFFPRGQVPTMRRREGRLVLQRGQAASLLAMTTLCAMPKNELSLAALLCSQQQYQVAKLQYILHYFDRLSLLPPHLPAGAIEFRRAELQEPVTWSSCAVALKPVAVATEFVADQTGTVQVVASHPIIGAGVLHRGRGEEEAVFCASPELCAAMFVCQRIAPADAVLVSGTERYSRYTGHGAGAGLLEFGGDHQDVTPRDGAGNVRSCWALLDPLKLEREDTLADQLDTSALRRELTKTFTGFEAAAASLGADAVSVSDWGCDPLRRGALEVKALVLWMAASAAGLSLRLLLPPDADPPARLAARQLQELAEATQAAGPRVTVTVGQLMDALSEASSSQVQPGGVIPLVRHLLHVDRPPSRSASSESASSEPPRRDSLSPAGPGP